MECHTPSVTRYLPVSLIHQFPLHTGEKSWEKRRSKKPWRFKYANKLFRCFDFLPVKNNQKDARL
jgi:hypothetical protein